MKIIKLKSRNILRLDAVEIEPDGSVVIVGGNNEQGKTSVLDSIVLAMGGRAAKHTRPLKDGADRGEIEIELDDFIVRRTYTQKGTSLKVMTKDGGATYSSPQKMLDALVGQLTFDPLAWKDMDTRKQVEVLKEMVGLDFSVMNAKRKELYDERTLVNSMLKNQRANLETYEEFADAPDEFVDSKSLTEEMTRRINRNNSNRHERNKLIQMEEERVRLEEEEKRRLENLEEAKAKLELANQKRAKHVEEMRNQVELVNALEEQDVEEVKKRMKEADEVNKRVFNKKKGLEVAEEVKKLKRKSEELTSHIKDYDWEKELQLKQAEFPIAGLAFDESEVLYKNVPFSQCSSAEKLRVSVAMGLAMNPKLKVLLIRDGSLLDESNLKIISEMVADKDAQIWIERVGKGEECSVIIEDGKVSE